MGDCNCRAAGDPAPYMHDEECKGRALGWARFFDHVAKKQREHAAKRKEEIHGLLHTVADAEGLAAGYAFRAEELRYDARGGMTEAQAARRFEPGARWSVVGEECEIVSRDESGLRVDSQPWQDGMFVRASEMTRENGWLLLAVAPSAEDQAAARASACGALVDLIHGALAAGVKPVMWSRDDMAEEQGETWDEPRKGDGRC